MPDEVTVGIPGLISVKFSKRDVDNIKGRFIRDSLYGPCMLVDRWSGLALDSTTSPTMHTHPVLWTVHALPWQQWRISKGRDNMVKIKSEHGGLALTTLDMVGDGSSVWLEPDRDADAQLWRLEPTDDRGAFAIYSYRSGAVLDATPDPKVPAAQADRSVDRPTEPILWSNDGKPWKQGVITRLPLA